MTGGRLRDQRLLFMGAGEAGIGTGDLTVSAMVDEGLSLEAARLRCWFMDSKGLVVRSRTDLKSHKLHYAHDHEFIGDLLEAVRTLKPTALIGVSGKAGVFTRPVLEAMAEMNERPIIFSLSNPTSNTECSAEEAYTWTDGRAIFASGSPFDPVAFRDKVFHPAQGNNVYIFPGVGLGVIACRAARVTDEMFFVAAKRLSQQVSLSDFEQGRVYPPLTKIREVSRTIAEAVADVAYQRGLAALPKPDDVGGYIESMMYVPEYQDYI